MKEFFKANEKVIWVVLLVILAPSFAATGLMTTAFQSSRMDYAAFEVNGETLSSLDLNRLRDRYARLQQVSGFLGTGFVSSLRNVTPTTPRTLEIYVQLNEAEARGLAVSPQELADVARKAGRNLIAFSAVVNSGDQYPDNNAFFTALRESQNSVRFTENEYRAALRDDRVGLKLSVREFEECIAQALLLEQFAGLAFNSVVVSDKEVYDEYEEDFHRRTFNFVRLSPAEYSEEARASITDADLDARWAETNGDEFRLPSRVALEIAQLQKDIYVPTEEEIQAHYDAQKENLYFEEGGEGVKGLEEVRGQIVPRVRAQREKEIVDQALAEGLRRYAEGERDIDLLDLFGEHAALVAVSTTNPFSRSDVKGLPSSYANTPALDQPLFGPAAFAKLEVGQFGANTVMPVDGGRYLYRIAQKIAESVPASRAEVDEDIRAKVAIDKATELAVKYLEGWKDRLGQEGTTFASLAAEKNLKVHTTEPLTKEEPVKFKVDGATVPGAFLMLQAGFEIQVAGAVGEPVPYTNPGNPTDSQVYLLQLNELLPADPAGFKTRAPQMRNLVERRKREAINAEFRQMIYDRAQVKQLYEVPTEEDEPQQ